MRHNPCPGGAYNIVGEKSTYRDNFNLITATAKTESCSIIVTYKIREQGKDQSEGYREYVQQWALCQGHKFGSKFLDWKFYIQC